MKQNAYQISLKMNMNQMQVQTVIGDFNSKLVRKMAASLGGDYQSAILSVCQALDEDPADFYNSLDESLKVVIKEQASR